MLNSIITTYPLFFDFSNEIEFYPETILDTVCQDAFIAGADALALDVHFSPKMRGIYYCPCEGIEDGEELSYFTRILLNIIVLAGCNALIDSYNESTDADAAARMENLKMLALTSKRYLQMNSL